MYHLIIFLVWLFEREGEFVMVFSFHTFTPADTFTLSHFHTFTPAMSCTTFTPALFYLLEPCNWEKQDQHWKPYLQLKDWLESGSATLISLHTYILLLFVWVCFLRTSREHKLMGVLTNVFLTLSNFYLSYKLRSPLICLGVISTYSNGPLNPIFVREAFDVNVEKVSQRFNLCLIVGICTY